MALILRKTSGIDYSEKICITFWKFWIHNDANSTWKYFLTVIIILISCVLLKILLAQLWTLNILKVNYHYEFQIFKEWYKSSLMGTFVPKSIISIILFE